MAYKKFISNKANGLKHLYIYLYNDNGILNDLNNRPAFTRYINGIISSEEYFNNGDYPSINKPHNVIYDEFGNIACLYKKALLPLSDSVGKYSVINAVRFNNNGDIMYQTCLNINGDYITEYFKNE